MLKNSRDITPDSPFAEESSLMLTVLSPVAPSKFVTVVTDSPLAPDICPDGKFAEFMLSFGLPCAAVPSVTLELP